MSRSFWKKTEEDTGETYSLCLYHGMDQAKCFGIRVIPTQIFYDKTGEEIYRHEGFKNEKDIVTQLKKLGVN